MGILNYTTKIAPMKTANEIQGLLAAKGAKSINIDYQNGGPIALYFKIEVNCQEVIFRLPCNSDGVEKAMNKDRSIPPRYKNREQAKCVAWRIVKDWVEAQLAIIESGQAELAEVFLPYAVIVSTGQTLFERMKAEPTRLLTDAAGEGR